MFSHALKSARSCTGRLIASQINDPKKGGGKRLSSLHHECKTIGLCHRKRSAAEIQVDFTEGRETLGTQALLVFTKCPLWHIKTWERSIAGCFLFDTQVLMRAIHMPRNLRTGLMKRHQDKSDSPAEMHENCPKGFLSYKKGHRDVFLAFGGLVSPSAILN